MKKHFVSMFVAGALVLAGASAAQATPITYLGTLQPLTQVAGNLHQAANNPNNPEGADYWQFRANAGDVIDIFGDRQVGHFDMSFWIVFGTFTNTTQIGGSFPGLSPFSIFGDDQDAPNIAGPFGDPHVNFVAPTTGYYTLAVTNFLSSVNTTENNPYTLQGRGIQAVPEPASMLLLGSGLVGLGVIVRRRGRA